MKIVKTKVTFTVPTELSEGEMRALDALVGYGFKAFIECFYNHLGKAYLEPYEKDLEALFKKVEELRPAISEIQDIRNKLKN
jgi:hypothetical protein